MAQQQRQPQNYGSLSREVSTVDTLVMPASPNHNNNLLKEATANQHRKNSSERDSTDESPLLPHDAEGHATDLPDIGHGSEVDATAGFWSSTINLANTILGTGMLAMPGALASVGIVLGSFMIVFSGAASALGLYFLTRSASQTHGRSSSFFACSKLTFPSLAVVFDLAIAVKCFGVGISYLIIIGDLMPQVIQSLGLMMLGGDGDDPSNPALWFLMDRRFWITVFMSVIGPLTFLKRLDSLKATSTLALGAVVYLVFIVVYYFVFPTGPFPPADEIRLIRIGPSFLTTLPIFVFSFTCHQNIFTVYNELTDNGQSMLNRIISSSIGSAVVIYHVIGILGYLTFGNAVGSNIIQEYNAGLLVTIGRIAIVVLVLFSFPLQAHPCRACLDKVLLAIVAFWKSTRFGGANDQEYTPITSNTSSTVASGSSSSQQHQQVVEELDDHGNPVIPEPSPLKFTLMTICILVFSYMIAITVSKLETVLAVVGSTGSTTISFILPGLFYNKLHEGQPWTAKRVLSIAMMVYGFMVMVVCLGAIFLRSVSPH